MTEIIEAIDEYTADYFSSYTLKNWGFCELMKKTAEGGEQPIPVTIPGRQQVSLLDTKEVITWVRMASPITYEASEEHSFGKKESRFATLPLRIVIANKVSLANAENLVFDYVHNFPSQLSVADYDLVFVQGNPSVDPDHEGIYLTELGNTVYEKHRFPWNVYAINLNVQFIICEGDYRYTEDGNFRVLE